MGPAVSQQFQYTDNVTIERVFKEENIDERARKTEIRQREGGKGMG